MNNFEEWKEARETVKKIWGHWKPHFEILHSKSKGFLFARRYKRGMGPL